MVENELVVRLVECAKPLNSVYDSNNPSQILVTGWADTTTIPKRGEICLEYYTNTDSSSANYGKICYRMKIGDGVHKYIEPDPDDSLPYFPLSDDVISIIVDWVNTHLNVNEYAQASYDNTNHKLKVYSISEKNGIIGHLADGTATPTLDVEITFDAGTKIDLASSNNTLTIAHEATTRSDTDNNTNLSFGDVVVTDVDSDTTGHVTGTTTYKLPENPVSAASGTTNQIMISDGDNTTSTSGKTITATAPSSSSDDTAIPTSKAVNDSIDTKINALDSSVSAGSSKVLTGVTEVDGKLTDKTDVDYTTIAPVQSVEGDNKWTSVSTSSNTATVSHIGPDTSSTSSATATSGTAPGFGGDVVTGVTIDSKGHVTGVTTGALPSNPVSGLEGTASDTASGITVQVDSTGGEVDNVDVTVALDTLKSALGLTGALIPKGTIGTGGTITTLPTASASNLGWAYKVITNGTYSGISAKVGDVIYCILNDDGTTYNWTLIPSGDESFTDTWRNVKVNGTEKLGTGISSGALDIIDGDYSSATWNGTNKTLQIDVDEASTSQKGVVQLTDTYTNTDDEKAATGKSIKAAIDTLDAIADADTSSGTGYATVTTTTPSADFNVLNSITEVDGKLSAADAYHLKKLAATGAAVDVSITDAGSLITATNVEGALQEIVANVNDKVDDVKINNISIVDANHIAQIAVDGTYDATNNKIASESTVTDAIEALDVAASETTSDTTGTGLDVITEVSETDGKISSKKKTLTEGNKIDISSASGNITINHESITTTPTDNSGTVGEKETYVITDVTTDGYGHVTGYVKDKSTNLIAADIKSPLTETNDEQFTFRETGEKFDGTGVSMGEDTATVDVIEGNTLVWNQHIRPSDIRPTITDSDVTYTNNGDGTITMVGTADHFTGLALSISTQDKSVIGHKIYITCGSRDVVLSGKQSSSAIIEAQNDNAYIVVISVSPIAYNTILRPLAIDLTKMFGSDDKICAALGVANLTDSTNLTTAAANFEKLFPAPYYPYCSGRLISLGGYHVKLNQLVHNGNFADANGWECSNGTISVSNGVLTATSNTSGALAVYRYGYGLVSGHKYLHKTVVKSSSTTKSFRFSSMTDSENFQVTGNWQEISYIENVVNVVNGYPRIILNGAASGDSFQCSSFNIIDLTLMFGSGSEPSTVEEVEAILTLLKAQKGITDDYIPYNTGEDMNPVSELGIESNGFNQWDEQWERGGISPTTGNTFVSDTQIRSKNYIPVFPNTTYYIKSPIPVVVCAYDSAKNFIGWIYFNDGNSTFNTVENTAYIKFCTYSITVTTYNNDICINISCDRDGQYEPYKKDTLDLSFIYDLEYTPSGSTAPVKAFPYGLLSAGSVADEVHETYAIKRIGFVDLGNQSQISSYYSSRGIFKTAVIDKKTTVNAGLVCNKYPLVTFDSSNLPSNPFIANLTGYANENIIFGDDRFINATASQVKEMLSGTLICYELETPVRIDFDTPYNFKYVVDDKGTEALIPQNTSDAVITSPFAGSITYKSNFKDVVKDLIGKYIEYTPTETINPTGNTNSKTLPTSQAVIDYMRAGGSSMKPVYESGEEVAPTSEVHAGLRAEIGDNIFEYYKLPFSAIMNDASTGDNSVQIILNGNFS